MKMTNIAAIGDSEYMTEVSSTEEGIALSGRFVFSTISGLDKQAQTIISNHQNDEFIVNCDRMTRIDSAGIALLIGIRRQCLKTNTNFRLNGLSQQALSLFEAYRLNLPN